MRQLGAAVAATHASHSPFGIRPCATAASSHHQPHLRFRRLGTFFFPAARMEAATGALPRLHRQAAVNSDHETVPERLAVVTGGNRGIGLEVCRQLALQGVTVILTARNEKRGKEAFQSLRHVTDNIIFHQLDILDKDSISSLAQHFESRYGKLDILVNNAGVGGVVVDQDGLRALNIDPNTWLSGKAANLLEHVVVQTYDEAVKCLKTNYYGSKWVTEGLLPLLKQSTSGARIVNTTSLLSELQRMPNEKLREELRDADAWDERRLEAMLDEFLEALKDGRLEEAGWPKMLPAYIMGDQDGGEPVHSDRGEAAPGDAGELRAPGVREDGDQLEHGRHPAGGGCQGSRQAGAAP